MDLAGFAGDGRRAAERLGWRATTTMPEIAVALVRAETAVDWKA
jgi:hypothetical protein